MSLTRGRETGPLTFFFAGTAFSAVSSVSDTSTTSRFFVVLSAIGFVVIVCNGRACCEIAMRAAVVCCESRGSANFTRSVLTVYHRLRGGHANGCGRGGGSGDATQCWSWVLSVPVEIRVTPSDKRDGVSNGDLGRLG